MKKINKYLNLICCFALLLSVFCLVPKHVLAAENVKTISIYDGSVDNGSISTTTIDGIDVTVAGLGSAKNGSFAFGDKVYTKLVQTGGRSSDSRYIKINVPKNYDSISIRLVFASNGSSVRSMGVSNAGVVFDENGIVFNSTASADELTMGVTERLSCGEYYITFNESVRIAELSVNCFEKTDDVGGSTSSEYLRSLAAVFGVCVFLFVVYVVYSFLKKVVK